MCTECYERMTMFSESAMYFGVRGELGIIRNVSILLPIQYLSFSTDTKTFFFIPYFEGFSKFNKKAKVLK